MLYSAKELRERVSVHIIPDASFATFAAQSAIERADDRRKPSTQVYPKRFDAVLFGANAIYLRPEICAAHTAGHLGLAIVAKYFGIPVIAISAAMKIETQPEHDWTNSVRDDKGGWLTSDAEFRERLFANAEDESIRICNLREDHVPYSLIDAVVTEQGVCREVAPEDAMRYLEACKARSDERFAKLMSRADL